MRTKRTIFFIIAVLLIVGAVVGLIWLANNKFDTSDKKGEEQGSETTSSVVIAPPEDINDIHLRDREELYEDDDPYDVVTMYLTVSFGNETEGTNHTWAEVNKYSAYYYDELGIDRYKVAGLLQVGDENGPKEGELGYSQTVPNATVQVRGQTSSRNSQKNYKIKLVDSSEGWRGQRTIALNKHQTDGLRFRNKMMYDLMADIPQIMGLRTQFVHLYVRDTTGDNPNQYVDYGLYTQVEQLNKTALKAHGLDKNGYLYKINYFEFLEYDEVVPVTDPSYDEKAFSQYLEPKGREDHTRLLEMIHDVNDYSLTSDQLLDKWFDRENLSYWMAFMMLVGNSDVQSRNVYIYSYLNGQKWYFYPWDNDVSFIEKENEIIKYSDFSDWQDGVTNYWCNMAFRRALMSSSFREELINAVEDLYNNYLQKDKIIERANKYSQTVLPYVFSMPDMKNEGLTLSEYKKVLAAIPEELERNYKRFYESLKSPMPFYVNLPEMNGSEMKLVWDQSVCFTESELTYHVWLSTDPKGNNKLFEADDLYLTTATYHGKLMPGQYFIHVDATNQLGLTTNCFDYYNTTSGSIYGVFGFIVNYDGSLTQMENDE